MSDRPDITRLIGDLIRYARVVSVDAVGPSCRVSVGGVEIGPLPWLAPAAGTTTTSTTTNNTTVIHHSTPSPRQEGRGDVIYDDGSWDSYRLTEDDAYEDYDDGWGDYIEDEYDYSYDDEGWGDYVEDDGWGDYADDEGWGDIF